MRVNTLARRYAQAILNSAEKNSLGEEILKDLTLTEETFRNNNDLLKILVSPITSKEKKKNIVSDLFGNRINPLTLDFLHLIIDKGRENIMTVVKDEYAILYNMANSVTDLTIESVIKLTDEQILSIKNIMEKKYSIAFNAVNVINEDLIGGVRLRFFDQIIDGSVKNSLKKIEDCLTE